MLIVIFYKVSLFLFTSSTTELWSLTHCNITLLFITAYYFCDITDFTRSEILNYKLVRLWLHDNVSGINYKQPHSPPPPKKNTYTMSDLHRNQNTYILKYYMTIPSPNVRTLRLKFVKASIKFPKCTHIPSNNSITLRLPTLCCILTSYNREVMKSIISNLLLCKQSEFISNISRQDIVLSVCCLCKYMTLPV